MDEPRKALDMLLKLLGDVLYAEVEWHQRRAAEKERAVTVARIRTLAETCGDGEVRRRFSDLASEIETGFHVLLEQQQEVPRG